jgi:hypothetical protein
VSSSNIAAALERVRTLRLFFGHQSVGNNILDGIRDLDNASPQPLNIVETAEAQRFTKPVFAHARLGANHDPRSKIDAFENALRSGIGERVNLAFMKLCYVDVTAKTDVEQVFGHYRSTMDRLAAQYPTMTLVHVTVPVTIMPSWPQRAIRTLLGRPRAKAIDDNLARADYNERLRATYGDNAVIFDLAAAQSTYPSGRRNVYRWDKREFSALIPRYSNDGRHLGPHGRRRVAAALLQFLAHQGERLSTAGSARSSNGSTIAEPA